MNEIMNNIFSWIRANDMAVYLTLPALAVLYCIITGLALLIISRKAERIYWNPYRKAVDELTLYVGSNEFYEKVEYIHENFDNDQKSNFYIHITQNMWNPMNWYCIFFGNIEDLM